ncbi:hypothetical protein ANO11243_079590 [Dothideomycetidae sp. 11243]|nr:hypothetical protein ANO11243_079590 [fungal sp. No.11243]
MPSDGPAWRPPQPRCAYCGVQTPRGQPCHHEVTEMDQLQEQARRRWVDNMIMMLDPHQYGDTRRRVHMIEHTYEMRVNEAWKHCLRKFPKALDRAWSEVRVDYPDHGMHRRSLHH